MPYISGSQLQVAIYNRVPKDDQKIPLTMTSVREVGSQGQKIRFVSNMGKGKVPVLN
jgi:hypothetical protein